MAEGATARRTDPIERATAEDMVSLATDVGSAPMQVGAVLVLDAADGFDPGDATRAVAERIRTVPRLRQRLVHAPPGCGRPVWVDDDGFDPSDHVRTIACPAPADEDALLAVAADVVGTRLPPDRPLWRLVVVTGLQGDRAALVIAFHHVLADGIGGLAVLANLVDGAGRDPAPDRPFPTPPASRRELALDAARSRLRAFAHLPDGLRRVRAAVTQLRPSGGTHAARCSLNRPTGGRRRFVVVRAELDDVVRAAHARGATVNDVVLAAVTAALRRLLLSRGEHVDRFVVSVPVAARRQASATQLGNQVGVVPMELPATGEPAARLSAVAAATRAAKGTAAGESSALLGPAFRLLGRLGLFQWFIDRQHVVHTFVTNLRGPDERLCFTGAPILDVAAIAVVTGNVTVSFAVLSYAGTLDVTVIADPDACGDLDVLRDALQEELDRLAAVT